MEKERHIAVFITTGGPGEAEKISESLLLQRQAACINKVPNISSRFWWQGKLESAEENLLIVKTRESLLPSIIDTVKKIHHDTVPEIIALPIVGGNPDYLDWIDKEVK
jgi:periplasmic divalent cation tolerance protein